MKTLYYTVERDMECIDANAEMYELTGYKHIRIYDIYFLKDNADNFYITEIGTDFNT